MSLFPEIGPGGGASIPTGVQATSVDYAIAAADYLILATTINSVTRIITLPAAAGNAGRRLRIVKVDNSNGLVRAVRAGADTINGTTLFQIGGSTVPSTQWDTIDLVSDGVSNWTAVHGAALPVGLDNTNLPTFLGPQAIGANGVASDSGHQHAALTFNAKLASDTTVVTTNTFQALLTLSPAAAGVYLISGMVSFSLPATAGAYGQLKIRLTNQAIDIASAENQNVAAATEVAAVPFTVIATLLAADTIQLLITGSSVAVTAKATLHVNGVGNNATQLSAVQIG